MKRSLLPRLVRSKLILPLMAGGIAFQLGGCDPQVKDSILTGVQSSLTGLVNTMISAVFSALMNAGDTSSTTNSTGTTGTNTTTTTTNQTSVMAEPYGPGFFA